ncbi:MAG TPA: ATP-binding protein [Pseudonocardiaceae bacterium]
MPSPNPTIVPPSRAARTRACDAQVAPLDITARAGAYHARQLRIALRQWLHTARVAPLVADGLTLAGYEALANVVEHAYPPDHPHPVMRLQAQVCLPLLHITITDRGRWRSPAQDAGYHGRGMAIMRAVTTLTHPIRSTHGTTVVLFAGMPVRRYRGSIMLPSG